LVGIQYPYPQEHACSERYSKHITFHLRRQCKQLSRNGSTDSTCGREFSCE
jgi:hypothetical protein